MVDQKRANINADVQGTKPSNVSVEDWEKYKAKRISERQQIELDESGKVGNVSNRLSE